MVGISLNLSPSKETLHFTFKLFVAMLKEFYPQRYTICETYSNQSWLDKSLTEISEILAG